MDWFGYLFIGSSFIIGKSQAAHETPERDYIVVSYWLKTQKYMYNWVKQCISHEM